MTSCSQKGQKVNFLGTLNSVTIIHVYSLRNSSYFFIVDAQREYMPRARYQTQDLPCSSQNATNELCFTPKKNCAIIEIFLQELFHIVGYKMDYFFALYPKNTKMTFMSLHPIT